MRNYLNFDSQGLITLGSDFFTRKPIFRSSLRLIIVAGLDSMTTKTVWTKCMSKTYVNNLNQFTQSKRQTHILTIGICFQEEVKDLYGKPTFVQQSAQILTVWRSKE